MPLQVVLVTVPGRPANYRHTVRQIDLPEHLAPDDLPLQFWDVPHEVTPSGRWVSRETIYFHFQNAPGFTRNDIDKFNNPRLGTRSNRYDLSIPAHARQAAVVWTSKLQVFGI